MGNKRQPSGVHLRAQSPEGGVLLAIERPQERRLLCNWLVPEGHVRHVVESLEELTTLIEQNPIHLCVLDARFHGMTLAHLVQIATTVPTLALFDGSDNARAEALLSAGADFMVRPLAQAEFQMRAAHQIRRAGGPQELGPLTFGPLQVDVARRTVTLAGTSVSLRRLEFDIFMYLLRNAGRWVGPTEIQAEVIGTAGDGSSTRTHVWEIRRKLPSEFAALIQTARGYGYRIDLDGLSSGRVETGT